VKTKRKIIEIDEELCDGCGQCILACAEGALALVDGKARLVGEVLCDGIGDCIGECPQGALTIVEREAEDFDEKAVEKHIKKPPAAPLPCGCPSVVVQSLCPAVNASAEAGDVPSTLSQWPTKIALLPVQAPYLKGAELLLLADCAAVAYPNLHAKLLKGKVVAQGCPKLDDIEAHIDKIAALVEKGGVASVLAVHMEVPCCSGLVFAAQEAVKRSGRQVPIRRKKISVSGEVLEEEEMKP